MPALAWKSRKKAFRLALKIVVEWDTPAERSAELRKAAAELIELAEIAEHEHEHEHERSRP